MKNATLDQARKILELFKNVSSEQIQSILESGFLADLRDANVAEIKRDEFRKVCGLIVGSTAPTLSRDMRKEGWVLLKHVLRTINSVADLELISPLKKGETSISGEDIIRRARKDNANFGQEDAEWLIANQNLIPEKWSYYHLPFPGTVWQGLDGDLHVPFLYLLDGKWYLGFHWLELDWYSGDRLVRKSMSADRQT